MTGDPAAPVWLLDVDGVLNGSRAGWSEAPRSGRATDTTTGAEYVLRWSARCLARIRTLHTSGEVDVRWATTWVDSADQLEALMGLPPLTRAFTGVTSPEAGAEAKVAAAEAVVASGRRLVWTDDDLPLFPVDRVAALEASGALLIAPDPRRCLREDDLERIERFVAAR